MYTRGEAIYTNYPIFVNVGFANGMVNAEWNDQSNASIPIENVVSELVLEDDPVNWASYSGTFVLNDTYENLVILRFCRRTDTVVAAALSWHQPKGHL